MDKAEQLREALAVVEERFENAYATPPRIEEVIDAARHYVAILEGDLGDIAWQFNEAVALLREIRGSVMVPADVRAIDDALPEMGAALQKLVRLNALTTSTDEAANSQGSPAIDRSESIPATN